MAVNNNTVTVTAGLGCTALTNPPIGGQVAQASMAYTDGDPAQDAYTTVSGTSAGSGTALHSDLAGDGFVLVAVPSTGQKVTLEVYDGSTAKTLGPVPAGFQVVVPVSSGKIIRGYVASGTQLVGVTAIKTTANA